MAFFGKLAVCDWCDAKITSIIMLNMDTWTEVSNGAIDHIMCQECIEMKLGREPNNYDKRKPWWPYEC